MNLQQANEKIGFLTNQLVEALKPQASINHLTSSADCIFEDILQRRSRETLFWAGFIIEQDVPKLRLIIQGPDGRQRGVGIAT
jgi:hypothetical protein